MTVLVTGIAGLIGGATAEALLARGDRVVGFDLRAPVGVDGAELVRGDLNDHPLLAATIKRYGVTRIVHAGAISAPFIEADNPFLQCRINILGTLQLFEAARLFDVGRIVNFGSVSGYGDVPAGARVTEETRFAPTSVYGVTKATVDMLGAVYSKDHGLDVVSFRPSLVYGPRRASYEPVKEMIRGAISGRGAELPERPTRPYVAVYAADVARAVLAALDAPTIAQRSYNLGGGGRFTLAEVAEAVGRHLPEARVAFRPTGAAEERPYDFDISAAARDLGYRPAWPLERAIPAYAEWLRQHEV